MSKRATIYLDPELHTALKVKAAHSHRSMSNLVNDAVREALREDREDLKAAADRAREPVMTYQALLDDLKAHGKL